MKPDATHIARATAERLPRPQRAALLLLHLTEPVWQVSSGIAGSTFRALRHKSLARHGPSEAEWYLADDFAAAVQAVVRELEGLRPLGE